MSYHSLAFLGFSAAVLIAYYSFGRRRQRLVLALANLAFYAIAGVRYLPFLAATMLATYWAARCMDDVYKAANEELATCAEAGQKKRIRAQAKARAKKWLTAGMIVSIGLLVASKYTGFLLANLNAALGLFHLPELPIFRMILPLGVSFYTFMSLGYLLDIYWKRYPAERDFVSYAAFLAYFPHVVQGPIDRYNEFSAQLRGGIDFDYDRLLSGAQLILWGFFKKLVVADRLGLLVDTAFTYWTKGHGFVLILSVAAYSIQIYADFSGCIDIVSGVSEMLGIRLRKNFDHPYFSRTMGEFWRRWHMSLMEWFKDYVYFPVSTSTFVKNIRRAWSNRGWTRRAELLGSCFPILVVWLISGIWHGAAWKYVVWGLFHAALLIGGNVLEPAFAAANRWLRVDTEHPLWRLWQTLRTFTLCCVGRVFFRANNLGRALSYFRAMLPLEFSVEAMLNPASYAMSDENAIVSVVSVLVLILVDAAQARMPLRQTLAKRSIVLRWALIYACLLAVLLLGIYGHGYGKAFIYEQF